MDIVIADYGANALVAFEQVPDGTQTFSTYVIDSTIAGPGHVMAADLDNDGDMDLVATSESGDELWSYINEGSHVFTATMLADSTDAYFDRPFHVATGDLTGNGYQDVVCGTYDGTSYVNAGMCLLYTSPSPRDQRGSRMPSSA